MIYRFRLKADGTTDWPYISESAKKSLGWDRMENQPNGLRPDGLSIAERDDFEKSILESAKQLSPWKYEFRYQGPSGKVRWLKCASNPIRDPNGDVTWDGMAIDITRERELESELESHRAHLLASARLSSLGEMTAAIAHEINSPLAVISCKSQQLAQWTEQKSGLNTKKVFDLAGTIEKSVDRIVSIIRGARAMVRDGASDPLEPSTVSKVIEDAIAFAQITLQSRHIQLLPVEIEGTEELILSCRSTQISQVIVNLLNNAADAVDLVDHEQRWVRIQASAVDHQVEIRVLDGGPGVPADLQSRIMDPFFTTKVKTGCGLGLSISRKIARDHGGDLLLDPSSRETCFILKLPRH